jgi:hypothetical protein
MLQLMYIYTTIVRRLPALYTTIALAYPTPIGISLPITDSIIWWSVQLPDSNRTLKLHLTYIYTTIVRRLLVLCTTIALVYPTPIGISLTITDSIIRWSVQLPDNNRTLKLRLTNIYTTIVKRFPVLYATIALAYPTPIGISLTITDSIIRWSAQLPDSNRTLNLHLTYIYTTIVWQIPVLCTTIALVYTTPIGIPLPITDSNIM